MENRKQTVPAIGDVVTLRSGGPDMTIENFEKVDSTPIAGADLAAEGNNGRVRCVWHDQTGKVNVHLFPIALLDVKDHRDSGEAPSGSESGVNRAISRQDHQAWADRPISKRVQSEQQDLVHQGDDHPQSLGHTAESQPAQLNELQHADLDKAAAAKKRQDEDAERARRPMPGQLPPL